MSEARHSRDVGLIVDDPHHQVARIIVELYDEPSSAAGKRVVETVAIDKDAVVCPPNCGPDSGPFPPDTLARR